MDKKTINTIYNKRCYFIIYIKLKKKISKISFFLKSLHHMSNNFIFLVERNKKIADHLELNEIKWG